ncbi:MAG: PAS domain-containing protein [Prevotella sp.]|nr:PAS domain-containing protein [Prevotella sp.]
MIDTYTDLDHYIYYTTVALLLAVFGLLIYNLVRAFRDKRMQGVNINQNKRLGLVLQTGLLRLWIYEPAQRHYYLLSDAGEYTDDYNPIEFSKFFNRDDFELLRSAVFDICDGKRTSSKVAMRSCADAEGECSHYEVNISVIDRDRTGRVSRVLGIQRDVTDDLRRKLKVNKLLMRYHTVFNSSLIDTIYYDKDGLMRDINDTACQAFRIDRQTALSSALRLQDNPLYNGIDLVHLSSSTRTTSIVDFDKLDDPRLKAMGLHGMLYYESIVNPIRNARGELEGVYMAGRNVTEMVESFYRQREGARRLRKATKRISDYIKNINYALSVSDVRLVNYYPDSYILDVSTDVMNPQMRLSQLRCIRLATPRFRRTVSSMLNRMDHRTRHNISELVETEIRDRQGRPIWLLFNIVPMLDAEGRVERYFGMFRNMTDLVETEQRLAVETKKAQETELLKQSFLTNMSYEIRTPLNTVVGFAELFEAEHDEADEPVFVEQIKKNSNDLLLLINDILFLSRLDANMIEYSRAYIDFSLIFESHCQMGWSSVGPRVKTIVENPYDHLVINIDQANLGFVIEKLCLNAARFTTEGTIRARYEYRHGELTISIEDTGRGMDEDMLAHVFERFARNSKEQLCGTGLDLPIVQTLMQQMGGSIEFQSEVGKGTTAWIVLPCEVQTIEKREISI